MATQLLLYGNAAPITKARHGEWSVKTGADYSFASRINSVPLLLTEFQNAGSEYALVFTEMDDVVMPAAILGIRDEVNLFVSEEGEWQGQYIPAFIRRYPFVFSSGDDGASFTLCIDEDFSGCNQEGRGERLFDADGERTQYLETMLGFLQAFQVEFQRTQAFCARLKELDLLEPMQAQFSLGTGEQVSLQGFFTVNGDRLNALPGDQLEELAKSQLLESMYMHKFSLNNFSSMVAPAMKNEQQLETAPSGKPSTEEKPKKNGSSKKK